MEGQGQIKPQALLSMWRSKHDIYTYFSQKKQKLLPSYKETKMSTIILFKRFLKQVISGQKQLLDQNQVKNIEVPFFPEVKQHPIIQSYLPDMKEGELPERDFFFKIVGTILTEWLQSEVQNSIGNRQYKPQEKEEGSFIEMEATLLEELKRDTFFSNHPGKGVFLLQKKVGERKPYKLKEVPSLKEEPPLIIQKATKKRKIDEISNSDKT